MCQSGKNLPIEKNYMNKQVFVIQYNKRKWLEGWLFCWLLLPAWKKLMINKSCSNE